VHVFALSNEGFIVHQAIRPFERTDSPRTGVSPAGQPSAERSPSAATLIQVAQPGNLSAFGTWYNMPNPHQGSTPAGVPQHYDSDPAIGQNADGRLEIFVRSHISLDIWHYYQVNASDPWTWVGPREPACLCNFPPCTDTKPPQNKCGNNAQCGNDGYDCSAPGFDNSGAKWWNTQAVFPTSDLTVSRANKEGKLRVFYRGFDGLMYSVEQEIAGNSTKYAAPEGWGTLLE
jgi:hypothetical protein